MSLIYRVRFCNDFDETIKSLIVSVICLQKMFYLINNFICFSDK